jgi:hypothetical protein
VTIKVKLSKNTGLVGFVFVLETNVMVNNCLVEFGGEMFLWDDL